MQGVLTATKEQVKISAEQVRTTSRSGASASTRAQQLEAEVSRLQQALDLKSKAAADAEQQVQFHPPGLLLIISECIGTAAHTDSSPQAACTFLVGTFIPHLCQNPVKPHCK